MNKLPIIDGCCSIFPVIFMEFFFFFLRVVISQEKQVAYLFFMLFCNHHKKDEETNVLQVSISGSYHLLPNYCEPWSSRFAFEISFLLVLAPVSNAHFCLCSNVSKWVGRAALETHSVQFRLEATLRRPHNRLQPTHPTGRQQHREAHRQHGPQAHANSRSGSFHRQHNQSFSCIVLQFYHLLTYIHARTRGTRWWLQMFGCDKYKQTETYLCIISNWLKE